MRRRGLIVVAAMALFGMVGAVPAQGVPGGGELTASFHAGVSGGSAVLANSGAAASVASSLPNPDGRILPFIGGTREVCDQLVVGTWVFWINDTGPKASLDDITNEFKLAGEVLDTVRTPKKRVTQGPLAGLWWFAEGVPVLGTLDAGSYELEWSYDDGAGGFGTVFTDVVVDASYC